MKTVFLIGTVALTVLTQAPFPFGNSTADQIQPWTAPSKVIVSFLDTAPHDPLNQN